MTKTTADSRLPHVDKTATILKTNDFVGFSNIPINDDDDGAASFHLVTVRATTSPTQPSRNYRGICPDMSRRSAHYKIMGSANRRSLVYCTRRCHGQQPPRSDPTLPNRTASHPPILSSRLGISCLALERTTNQLYLQGIVTETPTCTWQQTRSWI